MRMASAIPSGSEPDLVEVSEHRDEVGDEVDRTERVRDDCSCERIRVPRRARVAAGEVERERLPLELSRALANARTHVRADATRRPLSHSPAANRSECRAVQECLIALSIQATVSVQRTSSSMPSTTIPPSVRYSGSDPGRDRRFNHLPPPSYGCFSFGNLMPAIRSAVLRSCAVIPRCSLKVARIDGQ
jgi:hypothetical protein